jgi:hypothetical protein
MLAACAADIPENVFPCRDGCPPGFVCRADGYCWRTADGRDAGPGIDGGPGVDGGPARDGGPGPEDGGTDADTCRACPLTLPLCRDDGVCVGCLSHSDCTDPSASVCDEASGACVPCSDSAQCAHLLGLGVCSEAGVCVECSDTDTAACGGSPCTAAGTCSAYEREQRTCQPCDTDANCEGANYCVPMEYEGAERGGYCLTEGGMDDCAQPFLTPIERPTLSGRMGGPYCGIDESLATCEAVRAVLDRAPCTGADTDCPESGLCRELDGLLRCTYTCAGADDCPVDLTCTAGSPSYCGASM